MSLSNFAENQQLDNLLSGTKYVSLHDWVLSETGGDELSGGPGPYARQPVTFNAASNGVKQSNVAVTFLGLPGADIFGIGIWDAQTGGNFLAYGYCDSDLPAAFVCLADNLIQSPDHNVQAGDVIVFSEERFEGSLPSDIDDGEIYYVVEPVTDHTFSVAFNPEDVPESITERGAGEYFKAAKKTVLTGWKFIIPSGALIVRLA